MSTQWDKFQMAQKFLQKANAIHPEEFDSEREHDEALALQDVYYDCYMSSFSKEDLIIRLGQIIEGKIELPEEQDVSEKTYKEVYVNEARHILSSIERGQFP